MTIKEMEENALIKGPFRKYDHFDRVYMDKNVSVKDHPEIRALSENFYGQKGKTKILFTRDHPQTTSTFCAFLWRGVATGY